MSILLCLNFCYNFQLKKIWSLVEKNKIRKYSRKCLRSVSEFEVPKAFFKNLVSKLITSDVRSGFDEFCRQLSKFQSGVFIVFVLILRQE